MAARRKTAGTGARVADLVGTMRHIAPEQFAAEWDNVGLLAGSPRWACRRVLVAVDLTPEVLDEAIAARANAIVAYHPPIFRPVKRMLVDRNTAEGVATEAVVRGIAVYSPHTAWDAAAGGTNDTIAAMCGLRDVRPFEATGVTTGARFKFVVFVPAGSAEKVAEAMFRGGAGQIGDYSHCSFRIGGEGTFRGGETTAPRVGQRGRLERVRELRVETVVDAARLGDVMRSMRSTHPYEEPAFDIYPLAEGHCGMPGLGRRGTLMRPTTLSRLAATLQRKTGAANVITVGRGGSRIAEVLICVGAAGSLPFETGGRSPDVGTAVVTGEIRHHDALRYLRVGATAIGLGHWASERPGVAALARQLARELRGVEVRLSRTDRDPFVSGPVRGIRR